jgi:hypothetical protein
MQKETLFILALYQTQHCPTKRKKFAGRGQGAKKHYAAMYTGGMKKAILVFLYFRPA